MPHVKIDDDVDAYIREQQRRERRWGTITNAAYVARVLVVLAIMAGLLFVQYNGCKASDDDALDTIRSQDLADSALGGFNPGACAENESSRRFTATTVQRQRVSGTVCCGLVVKGCTIRW
jgi:hypothetical protein